MSGYYVIMDWTTKGLILDEEGTPRVFPTEQDAEKYARGETQEPYSVIEVPEDALIYL
jgi:hypothetical protein